MKEDSLISRPFTELISLNIKKSTAKLLREIANANNQFDENVLENAILLYAEKMQCDTSQSTHYDFLETNSYQFDETAQVLVVQLAKSEPGIIEDAKNISSELISNKLLSVFDETLLFYSHLMRGFVPNVLYFVEPPFIEDKGKNQLDEIIFDASSGNEHRQISFILVTEASDGCVIEFIKGEQKLNITLSVGMILAYPSNWSCSYKVFTNEGLLTWVRAFRCFSPTGYE